MTHFKRWRNAPVIVLRKGSWMHMPIQKHAPVIVDFDDNTVGRRRQANSCSEEQDQGDGL